MIESIELFEADGELYAWITEGDRVNALQSLTMPTDDGDEATDGSAL